LADHNQRTDETGARPANKFGFFKMFGLVVGACVLTAFLTVMGLKLYLFPGAFKPVTLNAKEERILEEKVARITPAEADKVAGAERKNDRPALEPMPYSEEGAIREISFTERELNALIAKNTDLAPKLAIDLSENLASARLRIPLDPDMPILGGETLKASAGLELGYADNKPIVILKGVMLWGVPIPNAWLGNLKNIDLVQEFESEQGFWNSFAQGIDMIAVENEKITVRFKE